MSDSHLYQKGQSGNPSGRPKGAKNKVRWDVASILKDFGCNPFKELAKLATQSQDEKVRCNAAAELAQYVAPKLKAIEHSGDFDAPISVFIDTNFKPDEIN